MDKPKMITRITVFCTVILITRPVAGSTSISVPSAGNCEEDTVLTCQFTGSLSVTGWFGLGRDLVINGNPLRPEDSNKYTETRGTSSYTLTIHNTAISDEGSYKCKNGFDESQLIRLNIECKASAAVLTVASGKKVSMTVDKLYPASPTLSVTFKQESSPVTVTGSQTCSTSTQYQGYYRCTWMSSTSLADGSYTYSLVVTTITQADPLTESFRIVSPQTLAVSNSVNLYNNRKVVYGNEGQSLTIECTSSGGFPAPTVDWYKNSLSSSNQMSSTSSVNLQGDGTYTVTLQHTFTPTVSDDLKTLICRSYYPQADSTHRGSKTKSVLLYLALKPSHPTVIQKTVVSAGGTVEVTCTTTGCRPAANISWSYQGSTFTGEVTSTLDASTETYTVVSLFKRQVTAADNGRTVQCVVTHPALVIQAEGTESAKLNIQFSVKASTTKITGNQITIATGRNGLTLNCNTGSSNPASDIVWKNGSVTTSNNQQYRTWKGENNGIVRSQNLVLYPTRYMDGDVITCSVSNMLNMQSPVIDTAKLNLHYSPIVAIEGQQYTFTEEERKVISCNVDCKPKATITWYYGDTQISQGTPNNKVLNYSLAPVNRIHYGDYRCKANNGIGTEDEEQISIKIKFKPLTSTITGNNIVIANGRNTLTLTCISGSSNPISGITWKSSIEITNQTGIPGVQNGDYGGMKRSRTLTLTPTRHDDGAYISCESKNTIGTSRSIATLDLQYRPMINSMSDVVVVEGNQAELICSGSSKPASTFRWYRGQSGILHQGTGTPGGNKLIYTMNNVRRTDAATYRCNVDNGIETPDNKNVVLVVYYPPDVTPETRNTTVKNKTAVITCNAKGVPDTNYRYGQWEQRWQGYDYPLSKKPGNEKLVLTNLTYEHSGVYTCFASNGIIVFGSHKEYMEGSVHLLVKSFPIIISINEKTSAKLKGNAIVEVYYYSNIEGSVVKIYRTANNSRQAEVIYIVSQADEEVDLPVFERHIRTGGTRALIMIEIHLKEDLGVYAVNISNDIGSSTKTFEIVLKGPPSDPYNVSVDTVQYNRARLSWRRGYHGGSAQTFVIRMSTCLKYWRIIEVFDGKNEGEEPISKDLLDLYHSTTYYVQMYAFNSEGNSSMTENLNFTTLSKIDKASEVSGDSSALIVAIVLGIVIVVVITYAVYATILLKRQHKHIQKKGISKQTTEQTYVNLAVPGHSRPKTTTKLEQRNKTSNNDASENQYTSLDTKMRNQESTYDAISAM